MCILSYFPPDTPIDGQALINGGISNPHGHGWAIVVNDSFIVMDKSLDLTEAVEKFDTARARYPGGPALFHSRWATHGSMGVENVHPFLVGGSHRTVVAHNGILPQSAHPTRGDRRSDTRKFAEEILPRQFRNLDRAGSRYALTKWCGTGNKLVILTVDPRYRCSAYLVNEDAGQWDTATGIWYSNGSYMDYPSWYGLRSVRVSVQGEPCEVCRVGVSDRNGYCEVCRSCQDCEEPIRNCLCWPSPAAMTRVSSSGM